MPAKNLSETTHRNGPLRTLASATLLGVVFALPSKAQMLKYQNEQEIYGAAAASPGSVMQVVRKLISFCEGYDSGLEERGEAEMGRWTERHAAYLAENAAIRQKWVAAMGPALDRLMKP